MNKLLYIISSPLIALALALLPGCSFLAGLDAIEFQGEGPPDASLDLPQSDAAPDTPQDDAVDVDAPSDMGEDTADIPEDMVEDIADISEDMGEDIADMPYRDALEDVAPDDMSTPDLGVDVERRDQELAACAGEGDWSCEGAYLPEADLMGAVVSNACFYMADLRSANLSGCVISNMGFQRADLRGADLSGCSFSNVSFEWANLRGADLSGVNAANFCFRGAQLEGVTCPDGYVVQGEGQDCRGHLLEGSSDNGVCDVSCQ